MKISNNLAINEKILSKLSLGPLSFYDFMEIALYDLEDGFYSKNQKQFGKDGGFITSHYHGKWLGSIIAGQIKIIYEKMKNPDHFKIVEYGPGEGLLAFDILETHETKKELLDYQIFPQKLHQ